MWLILLIFMSSLLHPAENKNKNFVILHSNDLNGRFDEISKTNFGICQEAFRKAGKCVGGFARIAHVIKAHRKEEEAMRKFSLLYLISGNVFTGSVWFKIHKAKIASTFVNALQPDAIGIGGSEFHYDAKVMVDYISQIDSSCEIVASTLDFYSYPEAAKRVKRHTMRTIGGMKIGFVGYVDPKVRFNDGIDNIGLEDEFTALREEIAALKREGAKLVVALGNSGHETDLRIAEELPDVDIVIGGGQRTFLWNTSKSNPPTNDRKLQNTYPVVVKGVKRNVLVVSTSGVSRYIGRLNITVDDHGRIIAFDGQPIFLDQKIPKDEETEKLLKNFEAEVNVKIHSKVAVSYVLIKASFRACRLQECNFGNLVTDSYVDYVIRNRPSKYWTPASIALLPGVSIKGDINPNVTKGIITEADLMSARPFDEKLVLISLTGMHLKQVLEYSASLAKQDAEGFLQISGLKIRIDRTQDPGFRVVLVEVLCNECLVPQFEPLDYGKSYRIITTEALVMGLHGHIIIMQHHVDPYYIKGITDYQILLEYLRRYSPVFPQIEGRIEHVRKNYISSTERSSFEWLIGQIVLVSHMSRAFKIE